MFVYWDEYELATFVYQVLVDLDVLRLAVIGSKNCGGGGGGDRQGCQNLLLSIPCSVTSHIPLSPNSCPFLSCSRPCNLIRRLKTHPSHTYTIPSHFVFPFRVIFVVKKYLLVGASGICYEQVNRWVSVQIYVCLLAQKSQQMLNASQITICIALLIYVLLELLLPALSFPISHPLFVQTPVPLFIQSNLPSDY